MENQFVPYELALKLKELGYEDKRCLTGYYKPGNTLLLTDDETKYLANWMGYYELIIGTPLWQQAFDWFREKGLHASFNPYQDYSFDYRIFNIHNEYYPTLEVTRKEFKTYKEVKEACLLKLIELCEKKK